MSIKPPQQPLTFSSSSPSFSAPVKINVLSYEDVIEPYVRQEFMADRLRQLENADGSRPVFDELSGNRPLQYISGCNTNDTLRPTGPDTNNIDLIYKRWDIRRWHIVGDPSQATSIPNISIIAQAHKAAMAKFDTHKELAQNGNIDYLYALNVLQPEAFTYLTTTVFSMSGGIAGGTVNNLLIVDFRPDVEVFDNFKNLLLYGFEMTLEVRALSNARSDTF